MSGPGKAASEADRLARILWEQSRRLGLVHIYTGNGKGKTTEALGLALRALGRDRKVAVIQFLKRTSVRTGELVFAEKIGAQFTIEQYGASRFASREEQERVRESGQTVERGWQAARELVKREDLDLVILDEVTHLVRNGYIGLEDILDLVAGKAAGLELVLTGRHAPRELIDVCDYVTEMREIKHPFNHGVRARPGTEF